MAYDPRRKLVGRADDTVDVSLEDPTYFETFPMEEEAGLASGDAPSPEPERPTFGPIPGMAPEQVDAVYKFASERAKPMESAGLDDAAKVKAAMDYADEQARGNRDWVGVRRGGAMIGAAISGVPVDEKGFDRMYKDADEPVRKADRARLTEKEQIAAALKEAERIATRGDKDRDFQLREKDQAARAEDRKAQMEAAARDDERADRALSETERRNLAAEKAKAAGPRGAKAGSGGGKDKKLAQIPAGEAAAIGELDAAEQTISELDKLWEQKANQPMVPDSVTQYLPGTQAQQYRDAQKAAAQSVGLIMEGGKLAEADLPRYMAMMPSPSDGTERRAAKVANIRNMLQRKREAKLRGLTEAGFDSAGFEPRGAAPAAGAGRRMIGPNGESGTVSADEVREALANGWKVVE